MMASTSQPSLKRPDTRFPRMPTLNELYSLSPTTTTPVKVPTEHDWTVALVGRQLVPDSAAFTTDRGYPSTSVHGVRGCLLSCVRNSPDRAMGRLPVEIVECVVGLLHDSVGRHLRF
jgi:hypothetical protein